MGPVAVTPICPLCVVSFPDSGRTWLRMMLSDLGLAAEWTHDGAAHSHAKPLAELDPDKSAYREKSVVFLARDPRDTAVSGYFQTALRLQRPVGTLSEFLRDERHGIAKIVTFHKQWFAAGSSLPAFLLLRYEAMHGDPGVALRRVARFAGHPCSPAEARRLAEGRRFELMQDQERRGEIPDFSGQPLWPPNPDDRETYKVRRGKVGGYSDYLSADDIAYCDALMRAASYDAGLRAAVTGGALEDAGGADLAV